MRLLDFVMSLVTYLALLTLLSGCLDSVARLDDIGLETDGSWGAMQL